MNVRDVLSLSARPAQGDENLTPDQRKLKEACREFESILLGQILSLMRASTLAKDPLDKGGAMDIMHSMQDSEMARSMTRGRGLGLTDSIYRELAGVHVRPLAQAN